MSSLLDDLRQTLVTKPSSVVFIVGSGVSVAALQSKPMASLGAWSGLLDHGLGRLHDLGFIDEPTLAHYRQQLRLAFPNALVGVADVVSQGLGAPHVGEFSRWLRETVGSFHKNISDRALLDTLAEHQRRGVLLATTNYDHLLETATTLRPATWRRTADVERALTGVEPRVLHLHGEWEEPESIVLGTLSYADVARDPHARAVLTTLRTSRTFVFVGCGAGLRDPNLGAFLEWTGEAFAGSEARHFRLCLQGEVDALRREHPPKQRLFPLPYGTSHGDLASFLRALLPAAAAAAASNDHAPVDRVVLNSSNGSPIVSQSSVAHSTPPMADHQHGLKGKLISPDATESLPRIRVDEADDTAEADEADETDPLIDDLGALPGAAAAEFVRPISRITGLAEEDVQQRLQSAPRRPVREIFKAVWPSDEELGNYTVAQVRRWKLTGAVARFVGLPYSDVATRMGAKSGQTKVRRVFSSLWRAAPAVAEEDFDGEVDPTGTPEDIEAKTVAFVRKHGLAELVVEITGRPGDWVQTRLRDTHGKTYVPRAFADCWPSDAELGKFTAASCARLGLVPRLARTVGSSLPDVQKRLDAAVGQTTLRRLFSDRWPAG